MNILFVKFVFEAADGAGTGWQVWNFHYQQLDSLASEYGKTCVDFLIHLPQAHT